MESLLSGIMEWWNGKKKNAEVEIPQHLRDSLISITAPENQALVNKMMDDNSEITTEELVRCLKICLPNHEKELKPLMDEMVRGRYSHCLSGY